MTYAHSRLSNDVCLFSICRTTYVCSRLVERRLWWKVIKIDETFHQTRCERLINFDENDLSSLMNENVISSNDESDSSNLTKTTSSHQIFSKRQTIFLLFDEQSSAMTFDLRNLVLQKIVFCVKINVCVRLLW
jgi:hypothetical protein